MFTPEEKEYLLELKFNPLWASILNKVKREGVPVYRKKDDKDSDAQFTNWVFESGRLEESERWFLLLTKLEE